MSRLESLRALVDQSPENSRFRFMLCMELISTGEPAAAVREFDELVRLDPDYVAGYFQAGRTSESLGDADAARTYYARGLEAARRTGDRHAERELSDALDMLG
jgi:tetratricopeptide (TPR) repeat protein